MSKRWVASVAAVAIGSGMIAYSNQNAAVAEPEPVSNGIPGSGPCASEVSNETHSLIPEKLEIPIPYPKITTVPYPAPVTEPVRVSQALPADTCTDPCPDLTDETDQAPGNLSSVLNIPDVSVKFTPFHFGIPVPGADIQLPPPPPLVHPATEEAPRSAAPATPKIGDVTRVAKVTGSGSVSRTDKRYQVNGTDLGIMWESAPDQIAVAFGDTVGKGFQPPGGQGGDWRSNVLGFSSDRNLSDGMSLDSMVQDSRCHAAELLDSRKLDNIEITTIPTSGFAVGNRQYMSYMSIRTWNSIPATWWTNYGGIAYSDDGGSTWTKDPYAKWDNIFGVTKFQVASMVPAGDFVYMFGTPNTRLGAIGLARVPAADVLNTSAYQYWQNGNWTPVGGYTEATPIVDAPAAELSVRYEEATGKWQMAYLDTSKAAIVLRESDSPQGVWSDGAPMVSAVEYPELYGGFIHPWSSGDDLYFTMSTWSDYNVFLMKADIGA
ncbi:hypothetical protein WSS_A19534 [Rhodococcus opacus M213]|uniref:DUF4185 domain-containing protein n=1 Tax=Rhodococcus opacus M213 TaxID=1129896 RepID=K8XUY4_RHOOP|nr:DUF4185 domain-containing protein [Rhodococcus opacus]EKT80915.1 hypothetical protein WSS_A19534 [Rhodococcus opacus M213]